MTATRRNPHSNRPPLGGRASGVIAIPDAATLKRWRAALVARRGYGQEVHPDYLAVARRQGGWSHDLDWRHASDEAVAWRWRTLGGGARLSPAAPSPARPPPAADPARRPA